MLFLFCSAVIVSWLPASFLFSGIIYSGSVALSRLVSENANFISPITEIYSEVLFTLAIVNRLLYCSHIKYVDG